MEFSVQEGVAFWRIMGRLEFSNEEVEWGGSNLGGFHIRYHMLRRPRY